MAEITYKSGDRIVALGPTSNIATVRGDLGTIRVVDDKHVYVQWDSPKSRIVSLYEGDPVSRTTWWATIWEIEPYVPVKPSWWARVWSWVFD